MHRRKLFRSGLLAASAVTIVPRALRSQVDDCTVITRDLFGLGPFYSAGAPSRQVLAAPEEPGTRLFLDGRVYARECATPMSNVLLDLWHADDSGCYSRFEECENPSGDDYKLRGVMRTGLDGAFSIETVKPGHYLNGQQFRPAHIHLMISGDGIPRLVTQLYFEGDQYIANDPAASEPGAAGRIIPLEEKDDGLHGSFDIILDAMASAPVDESAEAKPRLHQNHPNPIADHTIIPFELIRPAEVRLDVVDLTGRTVVRLIEQRFGAGRHLIRWEAKDDRGIRLPSGTYLCRLQTSHDDEATRVMTVG